MLNGEKFNQTVYEVSSTYLASQSSCSSGSVNYSKIIVGLAKVPGDKFYIFTLLDVQFSQNGSNDTELIEVTSLTS